MAQKKQKQGKRTPAYSTDTMVVCLIVGLLLVALGVLIFLANALGMAGDVFDGLRQFSRGMCGTLAVILPVIPIWGGVLIMLSTQKKPPVRTFLLACLMFVLICTAATLITFVGNFSTSLLDHIQSIIQASGRVDSMPAYLTQGFLLGHHANLGGGLVGMLLAWPLWKGLGDLCAAIIMIIAAVVTFLFLIRLDVKGLLGKAKLRKEERRAQAAAEEAARQQQELMWQQEQARRQQEQRQIQEQMRQQAIQHQLQQQQMQQVQQQPMQWPPQNYQQLSYEDVQQPPIVQQVQPRGKAAASKQPYGFQPTPEELGQYDDTPAPMPEVGRKKRGGVFNREKADDAVAIPRKKNFFDRKEESTQEEPAVQQTSARHKPVRQTAPVKQAAQPTPTVKNAPAEPVYPPEDKTPPRRRSPFQRPEPEDMDVPEVTYTEEPQIFDQPVQEPAAPAAQPVKPAAPVHSTSATARASAPVEPVAPTRKPVAPPEEVDTSFAAEVQEKPANENSFLARLRAARKAAGLEVPEDDASKAADSRTSHSEGSTTPRPAARHAAKPVPTEDDWASTPPWEDSPAPAEPAVPLRPVVTQKKPEGGYEPELNLKPRRSGHDLSAAPLLEKPKAVPYTFPSLNLLKAPEPPQGISTEEDGVRSFRLENTLQSFHVPAKVRHITHGPAISRFELQLAEGIKVSKVTDLNRNIAMNLEVKSVRIEAPIPGKSLVGVEIPNRVRSTVTLREILESEPFHKANKPLIVALGKDIAGTPIVCDLEKMPHLLIAGQTGSGKSVCINAIINSLVYRCSPKDVRLIMIDPKVVELQCYNGIPHLLIPVVSDPHKASGALAWAVGEMMDRYKRLESIGVRNIEGYNQQVPEDERMPRLVIIIDELADLMMTCKKDVEERINRLAQLARAAGIHLIVATQRPSTDVITGLIKANIPSRIAFKVASNIDSRTILGTGGAEQLLGLGDMLYYPTTESDPIRVQGCFLSDHEVNQITDFIRENNPTDYDESVLEELDRLQAEAEQNGGTSSASDSPAADENISDAQLLSLAVEMAVNDGQLSTSFVQRRLRLGYSRAGRVVDELEKRGIVGPKDGAKPRKCLISREEFEAMKAAGEFD